MKGGNALNRNISGYCDCFSEDRIITVSYLPVTMNNNLNSLYKKGLFTACSDCPLSNNIHIDDICPIYRFAPSSL